MKTTLMILVLQLLVLRAFGQYEEALDHEHHDEAPFHKITLITANSLVNNVIDENSNSLLLVPVFGFNYDYFFSSRWGIGLHNDVVLQQYTIERHHNEEELVRDNPVAVCGIISFKPHHRWTLLGGYGVELERHENISLFRFGLEYGIALNNSWELGFNAEYDHKIKAYSSFMFGFGFSKLL